MSGLLVIPTLFTPAGGPPPATAWPANLSEVSYRGSLTSPPGSGTVGTGWSRSGNLIFTTANNAVLQGYDLTGIGVQFRHSGCLLEDFKCDGNGGIFSGGGRNIVVWDGATDNEIGHGELTNSGVTAIGVDFGGHSPLGERLWQHHLWVHNDHENFCNPGVDTLIEDSVVHRFGITGGGVGDPPHYDGVECFGGEDGVTVARCVIFLTSDGSGYEGVPGSGVPIGAQDTWLPETGCVNLYSNIDDFCAIDSIFGGGSSCFNFDDAGGSPGNTNVRIGKNRSGASHPCYYVRDSANQIFRDDTNLMIAGWELYYAEDDATNATTFDQTLTASAIGSP